MHVLGSRMKVVLENVIIVLSIYFCEMRYKIVLHVNGESVLEERKVRCIGVVIEMHHQ